MGHDEQTALIEALHPLVERYGRKRIEQALKQIAPRKRGRPKGAKYLKGDAALIMEAYDEYVNMLIRFDRDPAGRHPKPSTHRALKLVAEKAWTDSKRRGGAGTSKALIKRLLTRFKGKMQPKRASGK
jgi:hypothetical protein